MSLRSRSSSEPVSALALRGWCRSACRRVLLLLLSAWIVRSACQLQRRRHPRLLPALASDRRAAGGVRRRSIPDACAASVAVGRRRRPGGSVGARVGVPGLACVGHMACRRSPRGSSSGGLAVALRWAALAGSLVGDVNWLSRTASTTTAAPPSLISTSRAPRHDPPLPFLVRDNIADSCRRLRSRSPRNWRERQRRCVRVRAGPGHRGHAWPRNSPGCRPALCRLAVLSPPRSDIRPAGTGGRRAADSGGVFWAVSRHAA
jgi:hypothetical protein